MVLIIEDIGCMPASIRPVGGCRYFQVRDCCKRGLIMFWHLRRRRHSPKHEQLSITTCRVELLHAMDYRSQEASLLEVTVQRLRSKALLIPKAPRRSTSFLQRSQDCSAQEYSAGPGCAVRIRGLTLRCWGRSGGE